MELKVGDILEGKVKSITNFGAFISLPGGKTGMVHISEVAHTYVADIHQHLTEGQDVKVMVLAADPAGKINLSIKRTLPAPERNPQPRRSFDRRSDGGSRPAQQNRPARPPQDVPFAPAPAKDQSFEDKLKQFMSESDSKLSSVRQYSEHKTKTRKR